MSFDRLYAMGNKAMMHRTTAVLTMMMTCWWVMLFPAVVSATQELNAESFQELMSSGRNGMIKFFQPVRIYHILHCS
jgi:hypothetical protein